eukprot:gene4822-8408_t
MGKEEVLSQVQKQVAEKAKEYFKACDSDGNGFISKEEWVSAEQTLARATMGVNLEKEVALEEFSDFDLNNDGKISEEEFVAVSLKSLEALAQELQDSEVDELNLFAQLFAEEMDETISLLKNPEMVSEWFQKVKKTLIEKTEEYFNACDLDGNGFIEKDEFEKTQNILAQATTGMNLDKDELMGEFEEFDTNNDGKISKEEFVTVTMKALKPVEDEIKNATVFELQLFQQVFIDQMDETIKLLKYPEFREKWFQKVKKTLLQKTKEYFKACDLDGNGFIEKDEFIKCQEILNTATSGFTGEKSKIDKDSILSEFKNFDINNDGKISEEEFVTITMKSLKPIEDEIKDADVFELQLFEQLFKEEMDQTIYILKNPLSGLTKVELFSKIMKTFESKTKEYFKACDLDGNGFIEKEEWEKCQDVLSKATSDLKVSKDDLLSEFKKMDLNNDGKVSEEEFVKVTLESLKPIEIEIEQFDIIQLEAFEKIFAQGMDETITLLKKK